jgi:hypothetical protein
VEHVLTGKEWEAMCNYIQMLSTKLPELLEIVSVSKEVLSDGLMRVEDELGAVMADISLMRGSARWVLR